MISRGEDEYRLLDLRTDEGPSFNVSVDDGYRCPSRWILVMGVDTSQVDRTSDMGCCTATKRSKEMKKRVVQNIMNI